MGVGAEPRALPGIDDSDGPAVAQYVDDTHWNVTLDVSRHLDLALLARVFHDHPEAAHVLACNTGTRPAAIGVRREAAAEILADDRAVRAATLTLRPSQADDLGIQLLDALKGPDLCGHCQSSYVSDPAHVSQHSGKALCCRCFVIDEGGPDTEDTRENR